MAYAHENSKGKTYYLHQQKVTLKSTGKVQTIYFFAGSVLTVSKKGKPVQAIDSIPGAKKVIENPKTGLPMLKGV